MLVPFTAMFVGNVLNVPLMVTVDPFQLELDTDEFCGGLGTNEGPKEGGAT